MTYLLYGENTQARDAELRRLIDAFIAINGEMAVDAINVDDCTLIQIMDAITTLPFLAPRRMVVLRYLSAQKELAENIETILDRIAETTDVIFVEARLDARSLYTKSLKKRVEQIRHFESVEGPALLDWIQQSATDAGGSISKTNAQLLIDRVGHNQQTLHSEIHKLLLISKSISDKEIIALTHIEPSSSIFAMLDAVALGNVAEATQLYREQRLQGMEPQAILSMIAWQLHIFVAVAAAKHKPSEEIARITALKPFVVRKNLSIVRSLSKQDLRALIDVAIESDYRIKSGKAKPDAEVQVLLLELARILKKTTLSRVVY